MHGTDGKYKSKNQIDFDIQCSYNEQILTMIKLNITMNEFSKVVHEINNKYHSKVNKYNNKETILHIADNFLYKVKNKGFNNYLFSDKISVNELEKNDLRERIREK